ncbi:dentin sialophosphoprotein-like [Argopecten irradians]|uniref:dentin sialophosphoprotein-like n=1 Tax=Argopecten irradians TaxID=31199 RepID=UPI00371E5465
MAMGGNESGGNEEMEGDFSYVTQLQALVRGYLTRRNLQHVRDEYEQIFSEVEGSEKLFVCWPLDSLCLPRTQKDRPPIREKPTPVQKEIISDEGKTVSPLQDDDFHLSGQQKNPYVQEKCTAETQTSFIEDINLKLSLGSSLVSQNTETEEHGTPGNMSSREESFTVRSDEILVQQSFDDSSIKPIIPHCDYDEKSAISPKSPDSSGGFEHSTKNSGSRSSSGRSQGKSSRISSEKTAISKPAPLTNRSEGGRSESERSEGERSRACSTESCEKSSRSNVRSGRSTGKDEFRSDVKSDRSDVSSGCSTERSYRSEVRTDRSKVKQGSVSKPEASLHDEEEGRSPELMTPRRYMRESSVLTNATSVWDSFSSTTGYIPSSDQGQITDDPEKLMEMRKNVAMELLWVQQAINSRKNYLKIKGQMKIPLSSS